METILSQQSGEKIKCLLCPHYCHIAEGKSGICGIRKNTGKKIELTTYGVISGLAVDPVEKKPLYHYFPGTNILSAGSFGCNMKCDFCQNYHISQNVTGRSGRSATPDELADYVKNASGNIGIAFTYNEPVIWFEFVTDVSRKVKELGFHTVMVSNGFVAEEPLKVYLELIDAFNIDLKAFSDEFYRKIAGANIEPVKKALRMIASGGNHLEITTLLIPGLNDNESEMKELVKWISGELGRSIPFHISRYYPMHKRNEEATPYSTILKFYELASGYLDYVYMGNVNIDTGQDTYCPRCKKIITRRSGYAVSHINTSDGNCSGCGERIYKNFTFSSS